MAAKTSPSPVKSVPSSRREFLTVLLVLVAVLGVLFHDSFRAGWVCFNNDAPLGANAGAQLRLPDGFTGVWMDSNWLGNPSLMPPDVSMLAQWFMGPVGYAKFWIPITCVLLGLCGWVFCKALKFSPAACFLGGVMAALHTDAFSNGCWGQVSRPMTLASNFLALAALHNGNGWRGWVRAALAGAAVGLGIMEGFDVGALFSMVTGAFVMYQAWFTEPGGVVKNVLRGGVRLALVAGFAGFFAAAAITSLIGTQIKGVANMGQDAADKARRWDAATQYCVPKKEVVTAIFPGVFGYRSTTLDGGTYWGTAGCTAAINEYYANGKKGPSPGSPHQVGAVGNYAGQLILILGAWAVLQSFRRKNSGYVDAERRMIWFWVGVVIICMLMMVGPYAPFYQFFYALPFASTIRNPGKFGHMMDWGIIVLGMYGAQSVCARLKAGPANISRDLAEQWAWWRKNSDAFEKNWFVGSVIAVGCALLGWLIYGASVQSLKDYLLYMDFDAASATTIASFSIHAVGWFVLFFTVTLGLVALVLSGYFAGKRATLGLALLAGILIVDLGRAHQPWINHWDAPYKYARNPVLEKLRERPWEYRVATLPFRTPPQLQLLDGIYRIEWAQHHFLSNDIQSLDLVQMPRPPVDWEPFERAMSGSPQLMVRRWQLTSTKYLLGPAGFVEPLNKEIDGGQSRFKPAMLFNLGLKPGVTQYGGGEDVTAVETPDGPYALIEFSGALPRAKLFANWQVHTNDESALRALVSPEFNPAQTVLVTDPNFTASASTNADAGSVTITNYSSKHITLRADATAPCVLLYNDRIAADWIARVDGVEQKILRCNYLMRGVQLTPGAHTVEFVYAPTTKFLYLSLLAIGVAFLLLGVLVFSNRRATA